MPFVVVDEANISPIVSLLVSNGITRFSVTDNLTTVCGCKKGCHIPSSSGSKEATSSSERKRSVVQIPPIIEKAPLSLEDLLPQSSKKRKEKTAEDEEHDLSLSSIPSSKQPKQENGGTIMSPSAIVHLLTRGSCNTDIGQSTSSSSAPPKRKQRIGSATCQICGKTIAVKGKDFHAKSAHAVIHCENMERYACPLCPFTNKHRAEVYRHLRTFHAMDGKSLVIPDITTPEQRKRLENIVQTCFPGTSSSDPIVFNTKNLLNDTDRKQYHISERERHKTIMAEMLNKLDTSKNAANDSPKPSASS